MMGEKPHILLTGASGTVGRAVLELLHADRSRYRLTVLDKWSPEASQFYAPYKDEIEVIYGDISKLQDSAAACKDVDYVIHLAALIPPQADALPELAYQVNVVGTANIVKNLELYAPGAFLLYSSSIAIYGDRLANPWIRVGDALQPSAGDAYARTKIAAEQCLQDSALDWSVFRLTAIMDGHKLSGLMFHMPLATCMEIATPTDTARALVGALQKRELLSRRIFNLGGGEACRIMYRDFLQRSFALLGLGRLNFPEKAFAEVNFHCGYYADGQDLEDILHFRRDTIDSYFVKLKAETPFWKRLLMFLLRWFIKRYLLAQSEPYHAYRKQDAALARRFFGASGSDAGTS